MKRIMLSMASLLLALGSHAQVTLENHYTNGEGDFVELESAGWQFYLLDRVQDQVQLFDLDHQLQKSIDLSTPGGNIGLSVQHVSEQRIDGDDGVEVICIYGNNTTLQVGGSVCADETDGLLFDAANAVDFVPVDLGAAGKKMFINRLPAVSQSAEIIDLPGFASEITYAGRRVIEFDADPQLQQYGLFEQASWTFSVHDANHTELLEVPLSVPHTNIPIVDRLPGQKVLDDDDGIELGIYSVNPGNGEVQLDFFDDDGSVLASIPGATNGRIETLSNGDKKLVVFYQLSGIWLTNIYSIPGFMLENTYNGQVSRTELEDEGERYTTVAASGTAVEIYNTDHTIDRTINIPLDAGETINRVQQVTKFRVNADANIEMVLRIEEQGDITAIRVMNEQGDILFENEQATEVEMPLVDKEYKLLMYGGTFPMITDTYVYSLQGPPLAVEEETKAAAASMQLYPNPSRGDITLAYDNPMQNPRVTIYNLQGAQVHASQQAGVFQQQQLQLPNLKAGTYLVEVQDNRQVLRKQLLVVE